MDFLEHVRYQNEEWIVLNSFLSGNGTYDIQMVQLKNIKTGHETTAAEIDVEYISPF